MVRAKALLVIKCVKFYQLTPLPSKAVEQPTRAMRGGKEGCSTQQDRRKEGTF